MHFSITGVTSKIKNLKNLVDIGERKTLLKNIDEFLNIPDKTPLLGILVGDWGTGKSQIIENLNENLNKEGKKSIILNWLKYSKYTKDPQNVINNMLVEAINNLAPSKDIAEKINFDIINKNLKSYEEIFPELFLFIDEFERCILALDKDQDIGDMVGTLRDYINKNSFIQGSKVKILIALTDPAIKKLEKIPDWPATHTRMGGGKFIFNLKRFNLEETVSFIKTHFTDNEDINFPWGIIAAIHRAAGGVPRFIELICAFFEQELENLPEKIPHFKIFEILFSRDNPIMVPIQQYTHEGIIDETIPLVNLGTFNKLINEFNTLGFQNKEKAFSLLKFILTDIKPKAAREFSALLDLNEAEIKQILDEFGRVFKKYNFLVKYVKLENIDKFKEKLRANGYIPEEPSRDGLLRFSKTNVRIDKFFEQFKFCYLTPQKEINYCFMFPAPDSRDNTSESFQEFKYISEIQGFSNDIIEDFWIIFYETYLNENMTFLYRLSEKFIDDIFFIPSFGSLSIIVNITKRREAQEYVNTLIYEEKSKSHLNQFVRILRYLIYENDYSTESFGKLRKKNDG